MTAVTAVVVHMCVIIKAETAKLDVVSVNATRNLPDREVDDIS